jgi:hypothetical protein
MTIVVDAANQPWQQSSIVPTGDPLFRKNLCYDPDTGMEVRLVVITNKPFEIHYK